MTSDPVVPGLSARQMLTAMGRIRQDTPGFLLDMAEQYSDLARFSVPYPDFWDNPLSFAPDRFFETANPSQPRFAYVPFGGGPRLCIGSGFAQVEANLILAAITQKYRLLPTGCSTAMRWLENVPGENRRLKT
jgi:hypothetical protein